MLTGYTGYSFTKHVDVVFLWIHFVLKGPNRVSHIQLYLQATVNMVTNKSPTIVGLPLDVKG